MYWLQNGVVMAWHRYTTVTSALPMSSNVKRNRNGTGILKWKASIDRKSLIVKYHPIHLTTVGFDLYWSMSFHRGTPCIFIASPTCWWSMVIKKNVFACTICVFGGETFRVGFLFRSLSRFFFEPPQNWIWNNQIVRLASLVTIAELFPYCMLNSNEFFTFSSDFLTSAVRLEISDLL